MSDPPSEPLQHPEHPGHPEEPGAPSAEHHHPIPATRRRRVIVWSIAVVIVALVSAALFIRLPYYTLSPGSSRATEPLITVQNAPTYDTEGSVDFLTVSLRQATAAELLVAWVDPAVEVESRDDLFGRQTEAENHQINVRMMSDSKDAATYQALTRLGYTVPSSGTGAVVATVQAGGPAEGVLTPSDVIVAVGATPVTMNNELIAAIGASTPGVPVELTVEKYDGSGRRVVTVTIGARPGDPAKGYLGVTSFTRDLTFDFPVTVGIDSGAVSGPSAGLAFTLGLLDVLSPGSLTGGQHIAATGTMDLNGVVGPVGGVHQKVVAARRAGATLMLVPSNELEEARRYAGSLRVEPADTLDDALAVLTTIGGGDDVLPPAPVAGSRP
ncbi:MAG: PDZ domain-containing protein [Acidobacteria bacterium]|nr:PDZ domain-containing protein [Acidobacteriota bacterium]